MQAWIGPNRLVRLGASCTSRLFWLPTSPHQLRHCPSKPSWEVRSTPITAIENSAAERPNWVDLRQTHSARSGPSIHGAIPEIQYGSPFRTVPRCSRETELGVRQRPKYVTPSSGAFERQRLRPQSVRFVTKRPRLGSHSTIWHCGLRHEPNAPNI